MTLLKTATEYRAWVDNAINAVTSASRDPDKAFQWVVRVESDGVDFEPFAAVPRDFASRDA